MPGGILRVARREVGLIAAHPALVLLTVVLPLGLVALLTAVFLRGISGDLPFAVVDLDRSETSRSLSRMLEATPELTTYPALSLSAASDDLRAGRARGAVLIPEGFERDLLDRQRPEVVLFHDNQRMTAGAIAARGARAAINAFTAGAQMSMLRAQGSDPVAVDALVRPIPMQTHALFNPTLSYVDFLLSALVPTLMQIMAAAAMAFALALDLTRGPGVRVLPDLAGGIVPAMLGKLLPYALIFLVVIGLADLVIFGSLGVPLRGSVGLLALGTGLFVLASLLTGALAFVLLRDFGNAISMVAMILAPAFGYMGLGFPRAAMPPLAQAWSAMLPGTWYLELRIDQTLRASPPEVSVWPLLWLLALTLGLALATLVRVMWIQRAQGATG